MNSRVMVVAISGFILSACAGSASHEVVSANQAGDDALTCDQIDSEIIRAQVVIDGVNKDKNDMTAADITDGILWFPFNLIAKNANYSDSIEAADRRISTLKELKKDKACASMTAEKSAASQDVIEQISKLNELYQSGAISEDEYKVAKQKLLADL